MCWASTVIPFSDMKIKLYSVAKVTALIANGTEADLYNMVIFQQSAYLIRALECENIGCTWRNTCFSN